MPIKRLIILLLVASSSLGSTQTLHHLRGRIAKPDPEMYRAVRDAKDWKNPYVIVKRDGIEIRGISEIGQAISVAAVREKLENLPDSAWPYGLVVALQEDGVISEGDESRIEANRKSLVTVLGRLGVTVVPWPS